MAASCLQILFARPPVAGRVKTRLGDFLGPQYSCALYAKMLNYLIGSFRQAPGTELFVFSADQEDIHLLKNFLPEPKRIFLQEGNDLGERLACAFFTMAAASSTDLPILIAGTDSPCYTPHLAIQAAAQLKKYDAVLGPARDGGYYMVGLQKELAQNSAFLKQAFTQLSWSHDAVCQNQLERFRDLNINCKLCDEILEDIDTFSDLCQYQKKLQTVFSGFPHALSLKEFLPDIRVILPVFNESQNLAATLKPLLESGYFCEVISADNGSTDDSVAIARRMGARVSHCAERGYGATCLQALADIRGRGGCDVVLFVDADGSDDLSHLSDILAPVVSGRFDFCLGRRDPKLSERAALLPHARFGNWLATRLIFWLWGFRYYDLGPFRAIRWSSLEALEMDDRNFGWTVQMQIRAVKKKERCRTMEFPVGYRRRAAGKSKVSSSLWGSLQAGYVILRTVFREFSRR